MSTIQQEKAKQRRTKFAALLRDMFQLDQPELDFGLYRIMHAKKDDINRFIDEDLPKLAQEAFKDFSGQDKSQLEKAIQDARQAATAAGFNPDESPRVKELEAQYNAGFDTAREEGEVYDALVTFFSRYYDEGDFISRRVYKDGTYAIPYQGEEVVLHWANKDQYYIKSSETLRDYTLLLNPHAGEGEDRLRVHFKLVDATEGAKDNNKETDDSKRQFVLCADAPFEFVQGEPDAQGNRFEELVCRFEFRPATMNDWEDSVQENATAAAKKKAPTQAHLLDIAEVLLLDESSELPSQWKTALQKPYIKANGEAADYSTLKGQLNNYTKKNTFDYFIHKDLGGFLTRELDFYIKNELMQWEDIAALKNNPARLAPMLSKLDVIRNLGGKIIAFLAQLEDFQKKLWLKKKFVTETNYCITLDRVPEELYPAICANQAQHDEWVKLFAIDEIKADTTRPGYSNPLTEDFLKANQNLVLDTQFFDGEFKAELVASIDDFDEQCGGLLVHSENFQALRFLEQQYYNTVKLIYLDPPYNTGNDGFLYKDNYKSSSWLSLMVERLKLSKKLLRDDGAIAVQISDHEHSKLNLILEAIFGSENFVNKITLKTRSPSGFQVVNKGVYETAEYIYVYAKDKSNVDPHTIYEPSHHDNNYKYVITNPEKTADEWTWELTTEYIAKQKGFETASNARKKLGKNVFDKIVEEFSVNNANRVFRLAAISNSGASKETIEYKKKSLLLKDKVFIHKREKYTDRFILNGQELTLYSNKVKIIDGTPTPTMLATNIWTDIAWEGIASEGGVTLPKGKKPEKLLDRLIEIYTTKNDLVLDFFGGTGTTASVAYKKERKFISIEQDPRNFNSMVYRISKHRTGNNNFEPHFVKNYRLESYEDTLGNLSLNTKQDLFSQNSNDEARQAYLLNYMLDMETRGSQSLLNIEQFLDPTQYQLNVRSPSGDETVPVNVDLLETFNYLLGLEVEHIAAPIHFNAEFSQGEYGRMQARVSQNKEGQWWFRTVYGKNRNGQYVLVVWRNLPSVIAAGDDAEARAQALLQDNAVLDAVLVERLKIRLTESPDDEIDVLYVNGDHNISIPRDRQGQPMEQARVLVTEEAFKALMFADTDAVH